MSFIEKYAKQIEAGIKGLEIVVISLISFFLIKEGIHSMGVTFPSIVGSGFVGIVAIIGIGYTIVYDKSRNQGVVETCKTIDKGVEQRSWLNWLKIPFRFRPKNFRPIKPKSSG